MSVSCFSLLAYDQVKEIDNILWLTGHAGPENSWLEPKGNLRQKTLKRRRLCCRQGAYIYKRPGCRPFH